jgi:hypothetical protein
MNLKRVNNLVMFFTFVAGGCSSSNATPLDAATATDVAPPDVATATDVTQVSDTPQIVDAPLPRDVVPDVAARTWRASNAPDLLGNDSVQRGPDDGLTPMVATQITPTASVRVERISYVLRHGTLPVPPPCDAMLAHQILVFVGTATPPMLPMPMAVIDVPASTDDPALLPSRPVGATMLGAREMSFALPTPVSVLAGQSLYVAIKLRDSATGTLCVATYSSSGRGGRTWWTDQASAPFTWASLSSFDLFADATIEASGMFL